MENTTGGSTFSIDTLRWCPVGQIAAAVGLSVLTVAAGHLIAFGRPVLTHLTGRK